MKTCMTFFYCIIICLSLVLPAFSADVPTTFSYQGNLTDKAGNPTSGSRVLVFNLYGQASGGSTSWTEPRAVTVSSGKFSAVLGSIVPLDVSILSGDTWLGITVQGEPEMTPRQKLTSVAYSLRAKVADSVTSEASIIPPGTVFAYAGSVVPAGWLLCDGRSFNRTDYPALFVAIGEAHGGNNISTFNLPDYRGRFLRGVNGTAGVDPDNSARTAMNNGGNAGNSVGSVQGDVFEHHQHGGKTGDDYPDHSHTISGATGSGGLMTQAGYNYGFALPQIQQTQGASNRHQHNINSEGGNETRPKNAYVNWIIKY